MASVNKCIIVGNCVRDPEMKTFPSGDQIANVTIATSEKWRDKNTGESKEATEFHRVVFRAKLAEVVEKYVRKGSPVYVEGSLKTRSWEKDGVKQYATEIHATSMQMLGGKPQGDSDSGYGGNISQRQTARAAAPQRQAAPAPAGSGFDAGLDDIPFIDPLRLSSQLHTAI